VNGSAEALSPAHGSTEGALSVEAASGEAISEQAVPSRHGSRLEPFRGALELLLVGGGTLLLLPACWWLRAALGLDDGELLMGALAFHAASLLNDPHFSVTYLLFYSGARRALAREQPLGQRVRYWVAGAIVPLALVLWCGLAIANDSPQHLGWLIQAMFVLVGWHYVKQGFGVLAVLSARRGVRWSPAERRWVLAHCLAGWAYAWASPFDPGTRSVVNGVFYTTWRHPAGLEAATRALFFGSALSLLVVVARKWRRERRVPPLGALAGLLISVWMWTVYTRLDPLLAYWIPALHSLQYLYFVGLLRRNAAREAAGPPSFRGSVQRQLMVLALSSVALGWLLLRGLPGWFDSALVLPASDDLRAMSAVGPTPYLAAFTAFVNIHHYFMDAVIWRRQSGEMRHLLPR
jgi:hypothetical protein